MSTQAEYVAAAKDYANAIRHRKTAENTYNAALSALTAAQGDELSKKATLEMVAQGLPADVP